MKKRFLNWSFSFLIGITLTLAVGTQPNRLAAQDQPGFDHLTAQDGLPDATSLDILQDSQGFMWFASQNGLVRYDGSEFIRYLHDPNDPNSLSDNRLSALHEDENGILWIATRGGGLNRLDMRTGQITRYQHDPEDSHSLSSNLLNHIAADDEGNLWIGSDVGVNYFNIKEGSAVRYPTEAQDSMNPDYLMVRHALVAEDGTVWLATTGGLAWISPGENEISYSSEEMGLDGINVWRVTIDDRGTLWLGSENGIYVLDDTLNLMTHYQPDANDPTSVPPGPITSIFEDSTGRFWVGTLGGGLAQFDSSSETFTHYPSDPEDPYSLSNDLIVVIAEDNSGTLWVSNWTAGLNLLSPYLFKFPSPIPLPSTVSVSLYEDQDGTLWTGTLDQGLIGIDRRSGERVQYRHDPLDDHSLNDDMVFALAPDPEDGFWVGTASGFAYFDPQNGSFTRYAINPSRSQGEEPISVRSLFVDDLGQVWIGTISGLFKFDPLTEEFNDFSQVTNGPGAREIWKILPAGKNSLWIGTVNGLFSLNLQNETFEDHTDFSGTQDVSITSLYLDETGTLWMGTWGQGFIRYDPSTKTNRNFNSDDGLLDSVVLGILADEQGNLWLSTGKGLAVFDVGEESLRTYTREDGLVRDGFAQGAYLQNDEGEIFLGIEDGIVHFRPEDLLDNPHAPPVHLTDFQLFNQDVPVGPDSPLSESITYASELVLDHDDSVFSFEFAGLNFINPQRNQYAYKMEGVDPQWNEVGDRRFVTYTNLDPGDYEFKVRAANNDGVWNEEGVSLAIHIRPPWWRTWPAYATYALFFLVVVGGVVVNRSRAQARVLADQRRELLWERRLRESLEQMDRVKDEERGRIAREMHDGLAQTLAAVRFRSRIWRTMVRRDPQQLLPELDDLDQILGTTIDDVRRSIHALRPLTLEELGLEKALLKFTEELTDLYETPIHTNFQGLDGLPDYLENDVFRITQELEYNAVRHGRPNSIMVKIESAPGEITLHVADDGVGFDTQQLPKISREGHFGLAQVKERVQLLRGTMTVDSVPGRGTDILIEIPVQQIVSGDDQ